MTNFRLLVCSIHLIKSIEKATWIIICLSPLFDYACVYG